MVDWICNPSIWEIEARTEVPGLEAPLGFMKSWKGKKKKLKRNFGVLKLIFIMNFLASFSVLFFF